jgi:hypothetical protein
MLDGRSRVGLAMWVLVATGCGARTVADDYRDAGRAEVTVDVPDDDGPTVLPDVACGPGLSRCGEACVDTRSDGAHCGACGVSCGPTGVCSGGTCAISVCVDGFTRCGGDCVDTQSDPAHCGACGRPCGPGGRCVGGICRTPVCAGGRLFCGTTCVDVQTDPAHCGRCGNVCTLNTTCQGGACVPICLPGRVLCGADCADLNTSVSHCGACNRACPVGSRCAAGRCEGVTMGGPTLQIVSLGTDGCRTTSHADSTGDDRGGIALGGSRVFYSGDSATVGFDLDTLSPMTRTPTLDGLAGEAMLPRAFSLAANRTPLSGSTSIVDNLIELDAGGFATGASVPLSRTAFLNRMAMAPVGIFSGNGRVIVTQRSQAWIMDIARLGMGATVTELSIRPIGEHTQCESWAFWGVAEFFGGAPWVTYVRDSTTIVRQNLLSGELGVVARFENLSDMCSFTVSPSRGRWYFHHEGTSQFASGDETLGFCAARITTGP